MVALAPVDEELIPPADAWDYRTEPVPEWVLQHVRKWGSKPPLGLRDYSQLRKIKFKDGIYRIVLAQMAAGPCRRYTRQEIAEWQSSKQKPETS